MDSLIVKLQQKQKHEFMAVVTQVFLPQGDGRIDVRHYVVALSTVHRPSASMETLKLAFKVTTVTSEPGVENSCEAKC